MVDGMVVPSIDGFKIVPNTQTSFYLQGLKEYGTKPILVGMSPGNGYYSEQNMTMLLCGLCRQNPKVFIIVPDLPHVHNFLGLGYSENTAIKKAKKDINQTKNRLSRALDHICKQGINNFEFVDWAQRIESNICYQKSFTEISRLYSEDQGFKEEIDSLVLGYLKSRTLNRTTIEINLNESVKYYLKELSFFSVLEEVLGTKSTIAYHDLWGQGLDKINKLFSGKLDHLGLIQYSLN